MFVQHCECQGCLGCPSQNGQTLVFENARVLPVPENAGDKVGKVGVGIYKQDREALTYLPARCMELIHRG